MIKIRLLNVRRRVVVTSVVLLLQTCQGGLARVEFTLSRRNRPVRQKNYLSLQILNYKIPIKLYLGTIRAI